MSSWGVTSSWDLSEGLPAPGVFHLGARPGSATTLSLKTHLEVSSICVFVLCLHVSVTAEFWVCSYSRVLVFVVAPSWVEHLGRRWGSVSIGRPARGSPTVLPWEKSQEVRRDPRDSWEIPNWVPVRIRWLSWIGEKTSPPRHLYFQSDFCLCVLGFYFMLLVTLTMGLLWVWLQMTGLKLGMEDTICQWRLGKDHGRLFAPQSGWCFCRLAPPEGTFDLTIIWDLLLFICLWWAHRNFCLNQFSFVVISWWLLVFCFVRTSVFCLLIFWLPFCVTKCYFSYFRPLFSGLFFCFLTIPLELLVSSCYRSSLLLRKYRIPLEARNNVPDIDRRPSLLPVDFNTPEGRECYKSYTRLEWWVFEGLKNALPIWLK